MSYLHTTISSIVWLLRFTCPFSIVSVSHLSLLARLERRLFGTMDVASIANLRFRRMMHCNDTAFNKCISQGTQSLSILLCLGEDGPQRGLKNAVFGISCIACLCPQGLELSICSEGHLFLNGHSISINLRSALQESQSHSTVYEKNKIVLQCRRLFPSIFESSPPL